MLIIILHQIIQDTFRYWIHHFKNLTKYFFNTGTFHTSGFGLGYIITNSNKSTQAFNSFLIDSSGYIWKVHPIFVKNVESPYPAVP